MTPDPEADTLDLTDALAELHEAGVEPCDCAFHQRLYAPHVGRLARGSRALARRAAGDDLRTTLIRLGVTAWAAPYAVISIDQPAIVPAAAAVWCIAAWRAGRPPPRDLPRELGLGIWALIGDQPAVHLSTLYAELQARPAAAHLTDERIRAVLDHTAIPVRRQVRAHGVGGRSGVHRDDLAPLLGYGDPSSGRRAGLTCDVDDELAPVEGA